MRLCADIALLDLVCAQLTETPITPPKATDVRDAIATVYATATLVDTLLVPAVRQLHSALGELQNRLSELLELLPYLQIQGPPCASAQIHATLEGTLRGAHTEQLNLHETTLALRRATLHLNTPESQSGGLESLLHLGDYRAEMLTCAQQPQRRSRLHVAWTFERSMDGQKDHHPKLSLLPPNTTPFVTHRPARDGAVHPRVPARWVAEVITSLKQTLAWLHADVVALENAWISAAAALKAAVVAIDWSPSDRLRAHTLLLAQLGDTERSLASCAVAFRWLLHFDALALIHPLPAIAER